MMRTRKMLLYCGVGKLAKLPLGWRWCEVEEGRKWVHVRYRGRKVKLPYKVWENEYRESFPVGAHSTLA